MSPLTDAIVPLMSSFNYLLPSISDPDLIDPPTLTVTNLTGQLPTFITFATTSLTIFPKVMT